MKATSSNCKLWGAEDYEEELAMVPFVPRTIPSSIHQHKCSYEDPPLITDVIPHILSFCDARTLSRASSVCRSWNIMSNADELWTQLCKETFGVLPSELKPPPDPTRILYVMSHLKLREALTRASNGPSFDSGLGRGTINNIQVISASTLHTFSLLRMND